MRNQTEHPKISIPRLSPLCPYFTTSILPFIPFPRTLGVNCSTGATHWGAVTSGFNIFSKLITEIGDPVDFELPDWLNMWQPEPYTFIKRNIYLTKRIKRRLEDDGLFCSCNSVAGSSDVCGRDCLCSMLMSSCSSGCKCGGSCLNKPFHQRPAKKMKIVKTEKCGSGIVADEDIKQGEFVIEYVGEVIDDKTCEERLWKMKHLGETNFYLCEINRNTVIDATYKGNKSRYINHSCCPNTEMQKWTIDGETRVGIFATCDIKKGEHLSYDYQFVQFGADQDCHCGAVGCRQKLGVKPTKLKISSSDAALHLAACQVAATSPKVRTLLSARPEEATDHAHLNVDGSSSIPVNQDLVGVLVSTDQADLNIDGSSSIPADQDLVGVSVNNVDEAYELYNDYAYRVGFSVRKGKQLYKGSTNTIKMKRFYCSQAGYKVKVNTVKAYSKIDLRTGCGAFVQFGVDGNGVWTVTRHEKGHNHELCASDKRHLLRSHRTDRRVRNNQLCSHRHLLGVAPSVWVVEMTRKFQRLIVSSQDNNVARQFCEEAFENANKRIEAELGYVHIEEFDVSSSSDMNKSLEV